MADKKENGIKKRLLSTFKVEAKDILNALSLGIVKLEKSPPENIQMDIVEAVYRGIHSLKGAARAVNLTDVEVICQTLENVFSVWKEEGRIELAKGNFEVIFSAVELINSIILSAEEGQSPVEKKDIAKIVKGLSKIETGRELSEIKQKGIEKVYVRPSVQTPASIVETVKIPTARLKSILLQTEEMIATKFIANQQVENLIDINNVFDSLKAECKKAYLDMPKNRIKEGKSGGEGRVLDENVSLKLNEYLGWTQAQIKTIEGRLLSLIKSAKHFNKTIDRMVDNLLSDMKSAMLLPFFTILEGFPLLIRNILHELGKEADVVIKGEWEEIDRRVLDEIKIPLMHLVRNCIDHGIEKPESRLKNGKKREGTITIEILQITGGKVEINMSDDGAGIDIENVKRAAVKENILSQKEAKGLNENEALSLIFRSGISTSPIVTDLSGRGLGLAIVREQIEKLNGIISVESKPNIGTRFKIVIPITVATFRGILVKTSDQPFILPDSNVETVNRIKTDKIKTAENRETVTHNGTPVSFVYLSNILGLPVSREKGGSPLFTNLLITNVNGERIAFGVDEVVGEQEVMFKELGRQLQNVKNIAGAAVFGSGKPVPILNIPDLMRTAVGAEALPKVSVPVEKAEEGRKSILVVEDSITSRILLKNILESAGYNVRTAVDGIDAITALKTEDFDIVVSDIEMPRMNGFDLTAKIRSDKKFEELPVVLVTALESREDRERGIDVGANAYIVKSSFDQSNLLEVVRRFI